MFLSAIDNRCIIQHGPDPRGGPDRQVWEYIMNFVRLGLKPRVYGGFAVLVVIALALACFAVWELLSIKTEMQKFSAINDNTARALQVSERIGMILRSNLRYTIDADEQATEDAETAEASAIELLKAASDATISEERRTIYNGLQSDVESLRAKRETLVRYGTQMTADRAKLFSGGDELIAAAELVEQSRAAITDQNVALLVNPVESAILLVRVANWRFLATRDPKGPATFKTNAARSRRHRGTGEGRVAGQRPTPHRTLKGVAFSLHVALRFNGGQPDQKRRSVLEQHDAASRRHGGEDPAGTGLAEAELRHDQDRDLCDHQRDDLDA
jgi:hypothetical protein